MPQGRWTAMNNPLKRLETGQQRCRWIDTIQTVRSAHQILDPRARREETTFNYSSIFFMVADADNLFTSRQACNCFIDTIFQHDPLAAETGLAANGLSRFAVERHLADGVAHAH